MSHQGILKLGRNLISERLKFQSEKDDVAADKRTGSAGGSGFGGGGCVGGGSAVAEISPHPRIIYT